MRAQIAVAFLIALVPASVGMSQESIPAEVLQKVKQASVFVKVSLGPLEYSGSGFVIESTGDSAYLVTNAHVVAKPDLQTDGLPPGVRGRDLFELKRIQDAIRNIEPEVKVVFNSGTTKEQIVNARVLVRDKKRDLAILQADKIKEMPTPIPLDISFRPLETTPVFIFGFPFGEALSKTKGNPAISVGRGAISSVRTDEQGEDTVIQIDGALNPGNSGGPVVDVNGCLVGVSVATIRGTGIGFCIPPSTLHRIISGGIEQVDLVPRKTKDVFELNITIKMVDPLQKLRRLAVTCALADPKGQLPDAAKALEGTEVAMTIENGKAFGTWKIDQPVDDHSVALFQAVLIDKQGAERRLPATRHPLKKGDEQHARSASRRRGRFTLMRPVLEEIVRDAILDRLKGTNSGDILLALRELNQYDPGEDETKIASALESLLTRSDEMIRGTVARLIGVWGSVENGRAVAKLLDDHVDEVRHVAMETLGALRFADAADAIAKQLPIQSDRNFAKRALIRLGTQAENPVIKYLTNAELPVRIVACEILSEIGSKETAIPALKELVERESGIVATRAREAVNRIQTRGESPLASILRTSTSERKGHVGLPVKQGEMLLTEGTIVLREPGPAIGLGIVQTGKETMEFTYVSLIRFPRGKIQSATFAARRKSTKNRLRVSHDVFMGDTEFTIEHLYVPDNLPFIDEEFLIADKPFEPKAGRLFLIDLNTAEPVIVQKNIELPAAGTLVAINEPVLMDLADQAIDDLLKTSDDVREFINGVKLIKE